MVALILISSLVPVGQSAEDVLKRFEAFSKKVERFEIVGTSSIAGNAPINLRIVMDRKRPALRFEAIRGATRFFSAQDRGVLRQLDYESKTYDDLNPNRIVLHEFRISDIMERTFPQMFAYPTLKALVPAGAKFQLIGTEKISGIQCDHVRTRNQAQSGVMITDFWIDAEGCPRQYVDGSENGHEYTRFQTKSFKSLPQVSTTEFQLRIPDGFVPFAHERELYPLESEHPFPLDRWKNAKTGASANLKEMIAKKGGLVLVLGKDAISRACYEAVRKLRESGVQVLVVEAEPNSSYPDAHVNEDPKLVNKLAPGDLPFGFVLDAKGTNKVMVQGFDRENPRKFIENVLAQLKTVGG